MLKTNRISEQNTLITEITQEMEDYRFYIVGEKLYHYVWHTLADQILEEYSKSPNNGLIDLVISILKMIQ